MQNSERVEVLKNKTLSIKDTQTDDEGQFVCLAQNDLGQVTLSHSLTVTGMMN